MHVRRIWPVAFLLLTPVLVACGDDSDDGSMADPMADPTSESGEPTTASTSAAAPSTTPSPETSDAPPPTSAVLPSACDLVTSDDIAKAFRLQFDPARDIPGTSGSNDLKWTTSGCGFEADDVLEVTVRIVGPDDFTQGEFTCPQPPEILSIVEPVDDVAGADDAWWRVNESPPLEALLRACTAEAFIEVDLEYEDGVDYKGDPRNQSIAIAELVLSNLQG